MAEKEYTTSHGEKPQAPEHVPNAVHTEPGSNVQMEDINIPLVAVSVAFFAVLLSVTIIGLQAWFYHASAAEVAAKTLPQEHKDTELGGLLLAQRHQLAGGADPVAATVPATVPSATANATTSSQPARLRIPVETAMQIISRQYSEGTR